MVNPADLREYHVEARSTDVFGRVQCSARNHHMIVDGPVQNGCPGEEITPAELFLTGVAACGVELLQVIARQENRSLSRVAVQIDGVVDRANPVRSDVTVFNRVRLDFEVEGVTQAFADELIDRFKKR